MRGRDCKAYYDSAMDWTTPVWVEIVRVIDLTINDGSDVASGFSRYSEFEENEIVGQRYDGSFTYRYKQKPGAATGDSVYLYLLAAKAANTTIRLAIVDGGIATSKTKGRSFPAKITDFSESQNQGDLVEVTVNFKSTIYDDSGTLREPAAWETT